jgi:hypothetical protein
MAIWCNMILLGQVMTRMNLDWIGSPIGNRTGTWSPFKIMVAVTAVYILVSVFAPVAVTAVNILVSVFAPAADPGSSGSGAFFTLVHLVFIPSMLLYVLVAKLRTRAYIRRKYGVRPNVCSSCGCCGCGSSCDDFCSSCMCPFLTTAQMDRHTADYDKYGGDCFSETGLPHYSPTIV